MIKRQNAKEIRTKKHQRVRKNISGTAERPRLCVYRSINNIYAQVIDDVAGNTLVAASTLDSEISSKGVGGNIDGAKLVGEAIAKKAKEKGIQKVVFDRGGFLYHGRVKALADAAREAGLEF